MRDSRLHICPSRPRCPGSTFRALSECPSTHKKRLGARRMEDGGWRMVVAQHVFSCQFYRGAIGLARRPPRRRRICFSTQLPRAGRLTGIKLPWHSSALRVSCSGCASGSDETLGNCESIPLTSDKVMDPGTERNVGRNFPSIFFA